jgi:hypothetical protein
MPLTRSARTDRRLRRDFFPNLQADGSASQSASTNQVVANTFVFAGFWCDARIAAGRINQRKSEKGEIV